MSSHSPTISVIVPCYNEEEVLLHYDAIENGFAISYVAPLHRTFNDELGEVHVQYPIRFSAGLQQETFFNFTHGQNEQLRPYVSITLF
jgi:hypothetical protein